MLVLGSVSLGDVVEALHPVQQQLQREINPKLFSPLEWQGMLKAKNAFARDVLTRQKIFLVGGEHELAEAGRDQS